MTTALTFIMTTNNHMRMSAMVIAQPTYLIVWLPFSALATANVAVVSAVLGNTKEYHVIAKSIFPLRAHDQCAPTLMKKNHSARPHSHRPMKFAIIMPTFPASSPLPSPMKSGGTTRGSSWPIVMIPAIVKPLGPTEMNMPGRNDSLGSFWVIRR
ncbi:hypothetical protein B5807_00346 [Epicoccum nigrum]|uniref:Uncharacterized protein n=1 Tax=Epicoccum nigrum TaxID=105696 RepID=A0A1Y2MD59_EPING|nr:hypothetical protein B5807_00346 [Epicoccum nigrum]